MQRGGGGGVGEGLEEGTRIQGGEGLEGGTRMQGGEGLEGGSIIQGDGRSRGRKVDGGGSRGIEWDWGWDCGRGVRERD